MFLPALPLRWGWSLCSVAGRATALALTKVGPGGPTSSNQLLNFPKEAFCLKGLRAAVYKVEEWLFFLPEYRGFTGGSYSNVTVCNVGDLDLIPGPGRPPGEGNGNPVQCCCLENFIDRGACWATVTGTTKGWTWLSMHAHTHIKSVSEDTDQGSHDPISLHYADQKEDIAPSQRRLSLTQTPCTEHVLQYNTWDMADGF